MVLRYYSDFKSLEGLSYRLEILTKNATSSEELILSADEPVTCSYSSDELCDPLKLSGLTINGLTTEILLDLHTGENHGAEVLLYRESELVWCGWMTTNVYDASYSAPIDTISLEAIDSLSTLDNVSYVYQGESAKYVTFLSILLDSLSKGDPSERINGIYVQNTIKLSQDSVVDLMSSLCINEYNFYDETDDAMTLKEVLEEICKFLGLTIFQWNDKIYLVDYEYIYSGYNTFTIYDRDGNITSGTIDLTPITTKQAGIRGNSCSIGIGDVYSKASVVASTNPIGDIIPELFDDLVNQNLDENKYYTEVIGDSTFLYAFFFSYHATKNTDGCWEALPPYYPLESLDEITDVNKNLARFGSWFSRGDNFETVDEKDKINFSWTDYLTMCLESNYYTQYTENGTKFITLNKSTSLVCRGGYITIGMDFKLSEKILPQEDSEYSDLTYRSGSSHVPDYVTKFEYNGSVVCSTTIIPCRLKIGDYYWNGLSWELYQNYLDKVSDGYYDYTLSTESDRALTYIKYYKTPIDTSTVNDDGTRSGDSPDPIEIDYEEYKSIKYRDFFGLLRYNLLGDSIFDWKSINNGVSYVFNLSDPILGCPIPLPSDKIIFGDLEFSLGFPNKMGTYIEDLSIRKDIKYFHIKKLEITYSTVNITSSTSSDSDNPSYNVFTSEGDDTDIVYSNIIDSNNVSEADDLELKINTIVNNAASYSSVATLINGAYNYLDTFYSPLELGDFRPEKLLVNKRCNLFDSPKLKYQNDIGILVTPLSVISTEASSKNMVVDYLEIDYASDTVSVNAIEI